VDLLYTIEGTETTENPIILLYGDIGKDESGNGISGEQFTRELMFLDTLNKKSIEVWINSGGGLVQDGEQIYSAILKSKTPVDTVNCGTAASIAGPIFLAGRNRRMMDFAKVMMHPVSGGDDKSMKAFEASIRTMLSKRSFLTEDDIKTLMDRTSWIMAKECKDMGLCTEIDHSDKFNVKNMISNSCKEVSNKVRQQLKTKKYTMNKVANKLGLVAESNEDAILNAIETMENKYKAEASENKAKFDKFLDEMAETKKAKDAADAKYNEMKAKFDEMEKNKRDEAEAEASNKAKALVEEGVKAGKIKNDAKLIETYNKMAKANYEDTKSVIDALPVNKVGANIVTGTENKATGTEGQVVKHTAAAHMAAIAIKNKQF